MYETKITEFMLAVTDMMGLLSGGANVVSKQTCMCLTCA